MKFNLGELENLFKEITEIVNFAENVKLKERRNTLYLANDEKLTYCVPDFAIAHLLGININYLSSTGLFRAKNSFELLKEMCENPYKIYSLSAEKTIDQKQIFSEHIFEKVSSFKENIKINIHDTEFVCAYNKNTSFYSSEINENCDYVIVKKYEDNKVGIILLAKNGALVVPMSNRIFDNLEKANEYLEKLLIRQEITILTGNNAYNIEDTYSKQITLNPTRKREKFNSLLEYKKMFNCSIDLSGDYKYMSNKLFEKRGESFENKMGIDDIVNCITKGIIIDRNNYLNSNLLAIIDGWNDYICGNPKVNTNGTISYTDAIKSLNELKDIIDTLRNEKQDLDNKNQTLSKENERLNIENKKYEANEKAIMKILKPEN